MVTINGITGIDTVQDSAVNPVTDIVKNIPCFSAQTNTTQIITSNVISLINVNTESFDTTNAFNPLGYVFNPQVAGYYEVKFLVAGMGSTGTNLVEASITKTGVQQPMIGSYKFDNTVYASAISTGSSIVYLNGTTDYIGLIGRIIGTGTCTITSGMLQAHLIVGA